MEPVSAWRPFTDTSSKARYLTTRDMQPILGGLPATAVTDEIMQVAPEGRTGGGGGEAECVAWRPALSSPCCRTKARPLPTMQLLDFWFAGVLIICILTPASLPSQLLQQALPAQP
eukprot:1014903-Pelagomonas_calceolata.AAC.5